MVKEKTYKNGVRHKDNGIMSITYMSNKKRVCDVGWSTDNGESWTSGSLWRVDGAEDLFKIITDLQEKYPEKEQ